MGIKRDDIDLYEDALRLGAAPHTRTAECAWLYEEVRSHDTFLYPSCLCFGHTCYT